MHQRASQKRPPVLQNSSTATNNNNNTSNIPLLKTKKYNRKCRVLIVVLLTKTVIGCCTIVFIWLYVYYYFDDTERYNAYYLSKQQFKHQRYNQPAEQKLSTTVTITNITNSITTNNINPSKGGSEQVSTQMKRQQEQKQKILNALLPHERLIYESKHNIKNIQHQVPFVRILVLYCTIDTVNIDCNAISLVINSNRIRSDQLIIKLYLIIKLLMGFYCIRSYVIINDTRGRTS